MKAYSLFAIVLGLFLFTSCDTTSEKEEGTDSIPVFQQFAYYKSSQNSRVFIFITPNATVEQIKRHAGRQMYTKGSTTVAYYYRDAEELERTAVTKATSEQVAMEEGLRKDCVAGYVKDANGKEKFTESPTLSVLLDELK